MRRKQRTSRSTECGLAPPGAPRKVSSAAASPKTSLRRRWRILLAISLAVGGGLAVWQFWRANGPLPPAVNTDGFDPLIAAAITEAREKVLSSPRSAEARGRM